MHIIINEQHFSTIIEADGNWHWTAPEDLPDGTYNAVMYNVDKGGLQSVDYTPLSIVVDTKPPVAPTLLNLFDDVGETGSFDKGGITDDTRPTLTGVAQKGTTVYLLDEAGNKLGSAVADRESGIWTIEPSADLKEGVNTLRLRADEIFAGDLREGVVSDAFVINVEGGTPQPVTVEITGAEDNFGTATGDLKNGAITDDQTPILKGTVTGGDDVTIYYRKMGSSKWIAGGTATVTNESWSWEASSKIAAGQYEFEARNGDVSSAQFVLDLVASSNIKNKTIIVDAWDDVGSTGALANGDITDDFKPTLRGRGEANSIVYLVAKHPLEGTMTFTAEVNSSGNWEFTPDNNLTTGSWSFQVKKDASATPSTAFKLILERNNAAGPEIESGKDDFGTPKDLISGDTTDDLTPKLIGTGTANTTINLRATSDVGSMYPESVTVNQYGQWSWSPTADMTQGNWKFEVRKEGGTRWESAFDLTLQSDSSDSGIIDWENLPAGFPKNFLTGTPYYYKENVIFQVEGPAFRSTQIIDPRSKKTSMGKASLLLVQNSYSHIHFTKDTYGPPAPLLKKFSVEIYNPGSSRIEFDAGVSNKYNIPLVKFFIEANSSITLTNDNFPGTNIDVRYTTITFYPVVGDVWIDNLKYEFNDIKTSSVLSEEIDDTFHSLSAIDDLTSSAIIGHEGQIDELYLTGHDQLLDLSVHSAEIQSIEVFDISGDGDNTLVVDINSLLQHGEKNLFIDDGKTQLLVRGDAGDTVQLKDILPEGSDVSEWVHQDGTVTVAGVEYNVYSHGDDAELLIQQGVKTELV
ncbi:hypothetical protein PMI17_00833 [Pantoea sp. GM01]|nr:hypothetical protein PMI17_00833 [Pantoea sp. GM01]